jgi:apolipoprotein N-acyltransferase
MFARTEYHPRRGIGGWLLAVGLSGVYFAISGPFPLVNPGIGDLPFFLLIGLFGLSGLIILLRPETFRTKAFLRFLVLPELLLAYALLLGAFSYIYALNANMDYVQRFVEGGGELRLALDTETERNIVIFRYLPFLIVSAGIYLYPRFRLPLASSYLPGRIPRLYDRPSAALTLFTPRGEGVALRRVRRWSLLLVFFSVALSTFAQPSFLALEGVPLLAWISLIPLLLALAVSRPWVALFYGVLFGSFRTLLVNFWLGTFSLVSLQFATAVFVVNYLLFFAVLIPAYRSIRVGRVLLIAFGWTLFEYLHSIGFVGYPWALQAHALYSQSAVIQVASLTGVWGVSFLVVLVNAALAEAILGRLLRRRRVILMPAFAGLVVLVALLAGLVVLAQDADREPGETVRIALVQQNSDPRKHDYTRTLNSLISLTDEALESDPDLVAWSETAFVPNIRRWSQEDAPGSRLVRLVNRFLEYQRSIDTWLLTGNDDYEVVRDEDGEEIDRLNYNAAVLFSPEGERRNTYRKIKLVPFTEHFPYREELPWIYDLLMEFDVTFWEPGETRTVFRHPEFTFSTPICYEDAFPNEVRQFVRAGAEVILNISNDYWSLTNVAAQQHFVAGLFRSVENRRPTVRATASGVSAHVDRYGRIIETGAFYEEDVILADVEIPPEEFTFYTQWGDWFPQAAGIGFLVLLLFELPRRYRERKKLPGIEVARLSFLKEMARRRRAFLKARKQRRGNVAGELSS